MERLEVSSLSYMSLSEQLDVMKTCPLNLSFACFKTIHYDIKMSGYIIIANDELVLSTQKSPNRKLLIKLTIHHQFEVIKLKKARRHHYEDFCCSVNFIMPTALIS